MVIKGTINLGQVVNYTKGEQTRDQMILNKLLNF